MLINTIAYFWYYVIYNIIFTKIIKMAEEKALHFIAKLTGKAKIIVLQEKARCKEEKYIRGKNVIINKLLSELYDIRNKK